MRVSVFSPVKNEAQFIGYSIMAVLPYVHEIIYGCAPSTDGTDQLLDYIKEKYAQDKLRILRKPEYDFNPHNMAAYNGAYNACIDAVTGDAVWFLHPDMIVTNPEQITKISEGALAWWTNITSYAGDYNTQITKGRCARWKNIHAKKFGLHYYGGYGSENEDMYFREITGSSYKHYGDNFKPYPFVVKDSGLNVNHYCELKSYKRRYEKMKSCLKTLFPKWNDVTISEQAANHPRVTLETTTDNFGKFEFIKTDAPVPDVFAKYREEFEGVVKSVGNFVIGEVARV